MLSRRLVLNQSVFSRSPVAAIKQILGQNSTLISYTVNSLVDWSNSVYVDVVYKSIPINSFDIYYIPLTDIKHLIPNSEKYVTTVNDCTVKLNNPKLTSFKSYLPIRIKKTIINDTDAYDNFYTSVDNSTFEFKTNVTQPPASYFGTTVTLPMNSLITPLSLINNDSSASTAFEVTLPPILYPKDFKPQFITMESTINNYKQSLTNTKLLSIVNNIEDYTSKSFNFDPATTNYTTSCYLLHSSQLPDKSINGIILLQPRRIPDVLLYYPTNSYTISADEINSIKKFIEHDRINYFNFEYLKNKQ